MYSPDSLFPAIADYKRLRRELRRTVSVAIFVKLLK